MASTIDRCSNKGIGKEGAKLYAKSDRERVLELIINRDLNAKSIEDAESNGESETKINILKDEKAHIEQQLKNYQSEEFYFKREENHTLEEE